MKKYTKTSSENDEIVNLVFTGSFSLFCGRVLPRTICVELCPEFDFV